MIAQSTYVGKNTPVIGEVVQTWLTVINLPCTLETR
jgi:hypothetical protein